MATGDVISANRFTKVVKLLDAETATSNGAWIDCEHYNLARVMVTLGGGTMSITVQTSNDDPKPAAATAGFGEATALTASGKVDIVGLGRWIKASGTITTGPVTAIAVLRAQI
jgi:hypothetical protein